MQHISIKIGFDRLKRSKNGEIRLSDRRKTRSAAFRSLLSACASRADRRHWGVLCVRIIPQDSPRRWRGLLPIGFHLPVTGEVELTGCIYRQSQNRKGLFLKLLLMWEKDDYVSSGERVLRWVRGSHWRARHDSNMRPTDWKSGFVGVLPDPTEWELRACLIC